MSNNNILVIEDDQEVCTLYGFFLEREGYVVHKAYTAKEAYIKLGMEEPKENNNTTPLPNLPNLIILDIMLPEIDGYTVASQLLKHDKLRDIPIIIITAKSKMSDMFKAHPNVKAFVSKPFDPKFVKNKIKELIG